MEFLPDGYESLKIEKPYWKMSQMKEGDNRLRIVSKPIAGWIDWHGTKPVRYRPGKQPSKSFDTLKPMRPFWCMHVWDYERQGLYVLEITQNSILKTLESLAKDPDWGDFLGYDIKIKKQGSGKDTKYGVTPLPHKPYNDTIVKAIKETPIRLEALYDGGDPWKDLDGSEPVSVVKEESMLSPEDLADKLLENIPDIPNPTYLTAYLIDMSTKTSKSLDEVVAAYIKSKATFLQYYRAWVAKKMLPPLDKNNSSQPQLEMV